MLRYKTLFFMLSAVILIIPSLAAANAYCSLRDPVSALNYLYPDSTGHQSIVGVVDKDTRKEIKEKLPFTIHFNELGKHTLYVALNNNKPVGIVHARTELTDWGLVEIAWSLNLNLTINNFYFQRCRIPECKNENMAFLKKHLKNKSRDQLLSMLNKEDTNFEKMLNSKNSNFQSLSLSIIQSALKTIYVTEIEWKDDIDRIRLMALVKKHFPDAVKIMDSQVKDRVKGDSFLQVTKDSAQNILKRDSIRSFDVISKNGIVLAHLVNASWSDDDYSGKFTWLITSEGKVLAVQPYTNWPDDEVQVSFNSLVGKNFKEPMQCNTFAELTASELFILSGLKN